ncbi:Uncharacterised protein [Escherichia coli]|nr:Uncharacterised protein [Escherichia coli]
MAGHALMLQCIPARTRTNLINHYYKINKYISVNYVKHPFIKLLMDCRCCSFELQFKLNKYTAQEIPQWLLTRLFAPESMKI